MISQLPDPNPSFIEGGICLGEDKTASPVLEGCRRQGHRSEKFIPTFLFALIPSRYYLSHGLKIQAVGDLVGSYGNGMIVSVLTQIFVKFHRRLHHSGLKKVTCDSYRTVPSHDGKDHHVLVTLVELRFFKQLSSVGLGISCRSACSRRSACRCRSADRC